MTGYRLTHKGRQYADSRLAFTGVYFQDYAPPKRRRWVLGKQIRLFAPEYLLLVFGLLLILGALTGWRP